MIFKAGFFLSWICICAGNWRTLIEVRMLLDIPGFNAGQVKSRISPCLALLFGCNALYQLLVVDKGAGWSGLHLSSTSASVDSSWRWMFILPLEGQIREDEAKFKNVCMFEWRVKVIFFIYRCGRLLQWLQMKSTVVQIADLGSALDLRANFAKEMFYDFLFVSDMTEFYVNIALFK